VLLFIYSVVAEPPQLEPVIEVPQIDKIGHGIGYFVFGLLLILALLRSQRGSSWRWLMTAGLVAVAYGGLMEAFQGLVPDREMDLVDLGADALGAFGGAALGLRIQQASRLDAAAKVY